MTSMLETLTHLCHSAASCGPQLLVLLVVAPEAVLWQQYIFIQIESAIQGWN